MDSIVATVTTAVTAASSLILAESVPAEAQVELRNFLIPLIGSMIASGGAIMLNPEPELKKIVIGRSLIALLCGVVIPQMLGAVHPAFDSMRPIVSCGFSSAISAGCYILSRPLFARLYRQAGANAERIADEIEKRYLPPLARELANNTAATEANTAQRVLSAEHSTEPAKVEIVNAPENPVPIINSPKK